MQDSNTYEELVRIKRVALEKLDKLIQLEIDRLFQLDSNSPVYDDFVIEYDKDYFSEEEEKAVIPIIRKLNAISSSRSELDRKEKLIYWKVTMLTRPISYPWRDF